MTFRQKKYAELHLAVTLCVGLCLEAHKLATPLERKGGGGKVVCTGNLENER